MFSASASAQEKIIKVCVTDARNDAGLRNVTVNVITSELTLTADTGGNGCVYVSGQIPVANEEEVMLESGLVSGSPFPNPASRHISIPVYTDERAATSILLFDVQGRRVPVQVSSSKAGNTRVFDVDLAGLANGVYFFRVIGEDGIATGKFIKRADVSMAEPPAGSAGKWLSPQVRTEAAGKEDNTPLSMADSVTIEVFKEGFVSLLDRRVLSNFETVDYTLFKSASERIPLIDMYGVKYLGLYEGGLYPGQQNEMPASHFEAGLDHARSIEPLDISGNPDPQGKIVMTSIGMSTTSSIFCGVADPNEPCKEGTFMDVLTREQGINTHLVVIDGADPGKTADEWDDPDHNAYNRVQNEELEPFGLSELQVQVAWANMASSVPEVSLPASEANAFLLEMQYGDVMRALAIRYPNIKQVFFASRVYGGYAVTELNPEPFAYESGFAVKWTIEAQIRQMEEEGAPVDGIAGNLDYNTASPWIAWGPYLWADGTSPRSDGLFWLPEDLKEDGTHLNRAGIEKITPLLLDFFRTSRLTRCWFVEGGEACE